MKNIDFFISYSSNDKNIVDSLVESLESMGAKCWYAPRDVQGRYAKAICEAIENAKVFLLCLSKNSAKSEHVLNEIEMAYSHKKMTNGAISIEPVCIENIDIDCKEFDEIMYYIRRINFIIPQDIGSSYLIAKEVVKNNSSLFGAFESKKKERTASSYFTDDIEKKRLIIQNELIKKFDHEVYEKVYNSFHNPIFLDVGCGNGDILINRFGVDNYTLIGVDHDEKSILEAKNNHNFAKFYNLDVEDDNFADKLDDIMIQNNIQSFDIIHISMVLLHLKSQCKLLRILRRVLTNNGILIIKDIDDGLNFAYPDDNDDFEKIYKLCAHDELAGDRHNGRQIYTNLVRAGYKKISLEKQGFSSVGLNYDEKENLFKLYFKFILDDIKYMHEKYPNNIQIEEEYEWYKQNYERIHDNFMMDDFVFSLGFQIYLAQK